MDNTCAGESKGALCQLPNSSSSLGNANISSGYAVDNWKLTVEPDQLQSEASIFTSSNEDLKVNNFMGHRNCYNERSQQEANQRKQAQDQSNEMSQVDIPMHIKETTITERNPDQSVSASVLHHSLYASNQLYPLENVKDKFPGGEHGHLNASDTGMKLAKVKVASNVQL